MINQAWSWFSLNKNLRISFFYFFFRHSSQVFKNNTRIRMMKKLPLVPRSGVIYSQFQQPEKLKIFGFVCKGGKDKNKGNKMIIVCYTTQQENERFLTRVILKNYTKLNELSFRAAYDTFFPISVGKAAVVCVQWRVRNWLFWINWQPNTLKIMVWYNNLKNGVQGCGLFRGRMWGGIYPTTSRSVRHALHARKSQGFINLE